MSDLIDLAKKHGTDKWGRHFYAKYYDTYLSKFRNQKLNLLEIGVGGYENPSEGGDSLRMWKEYFPKGNIVGIDIHDKSSLSESRIQIFQGSQDDRDFLQHVVSKVGGVDIIIDDGSHVNSHVLISFEILFPLLSENGIYVVEDTQTSYWPHRGGDSFNLNNKKCSMGFLKSLVDGLNYQEFDNPFYSPSYTDKNITGISFFHNIVFIEKGKNSEGSNICKNNRMGQKTIGQNIRYWKRFLSSLLLRH
jgi:hypothetical protein